MSPKQTRPTSAAQWELYHPQDRRSHCAAAALTEALQAAERAIAEGKCAGASAEVRAEVAIETFVVPVATKYASVGALDTEPIANAASWLVYFIENNLKPDPVVKSKAANPEAHDWACIAHDGFPCDCGGIKPAAPKVEPTKPAGKVLLWASRIKNVFRSQDCVHVVDLTSGGEGECIAIVRTLDDAKKVAAALMPGAQIITE